MQTDLDRVQEWIATYPGHDILNQFSVDYTDKIPGTGGIFPNGTVEIARTPDILGNVHVVNQYNFGLFYRFQKSPGDSEGAEVNADWVFDFQKWVQDQSCMGLAPTFGDCPENEKITAQNGTMIDASDEGWAMYMIQLSVQFEKFYRR